MNSPGNNTRKKKTRISKVASCIRKTANTMRLKRTMMPDSSNFNPEEITSEMSSKFTRIIQKIKELDAQDLSKDGKMYKHFMFTDIRESAYGVKALAAFMIAAGFDLRMKLQQKLVKRGDRMVATKDGETVYNPGPTKEGGSNNFAILQSLPLWNNPLSVVTKKAIIKAFNERPDNIYGEKLRIIILDSKFKEGIDLFDVKYVHLVEPAIATSDLKQAVGRATRYCGQRGLPFLPRRGWPLQVYIYNTILPSTEPFLLEDQAHVDAHSLMLAKSGLDLALLNLTKELTVLAIQSAVDYDLNFKINNFDIESALLEATDQDVLVAEAEAKVGGVRPKIVAVHDPESLTPELLEKCAKGQSTLFPFSIDHMRSVAAALGVPIPKKTNRATFCEMMKAHPGYLQALIAAPVKLRKRADVSSLVPSASHSVRSTPIANYLESRKPLNSAAHDEALLAVRSLFKTPAPSPKLAVEVRNSLKSVSFENFQKDISEMYKKFKWDSPVVKNGCEAVAAGKPGSAVSFTKTQDFVRHYLTPVSPHKGLLAWHSVGTGKTCMAVAAATTQFEKQGYTILWVTRNALMADVYKNIFGSVCSIPIIEKLEKGLEIPTDPSKQKRLLSRAWLPPISYRTFQNALENKNELGRMLHKKNPSDPLHKTFLIIDEVHKLQDGDLSASEAADFFKIQNYIFKSYETSGKESVRPLIMTATPITDSPKELFEILNTLIPEKSQRFMDFLTFREKYTNAQGEIGADGRAYFQQRARGLISYLNREFDPTTFSQPVFHTISVPIAGARTLPTAAELAEKCVTNLGIDALISESIKEQDCSGAGGEEDKQIDELNEQLTAVETSMLALKDKEGTAKEKADDMAKLKADMKKIKDDIRTQERKKKFTSDECEKVNKEAQRAMKKLNKEGVFGFLKAANQCYDAEEKVFGKPGKEDTQLSAMKKCFAGSRKSPGAAAESPKNKTQKKKKQTSAFVDKDEFLNEVKRILHIE